MRKRKRQCHKQWILLTFTVLMDENLDADRNRDSRFWKVMKNKANNIRNVNRKRNAHIPNTQEKKTGKMYIRHYLYGSIYLRKSCISTWNWNGKWLAVDGEWVISYWIHETCNMQHTNMSNIPFSLSFKCKHSTKRAQSQHLNSNVFHELLCGSGDHAVKIRFPA